MLSEFQKKAREFAIKAQEHVASGIATTVPHESDPSVLLSDNHYDVFKIKEGGVKAVCIKSAFKDLAVSLSHKPDDYKEKFLHYVSGQLGKFSVVPEESICWDPHFEDEKGHVARAMELLSSTGFALGAGPKRAQCFYTLQDGTQTAQKRYHADQFDITILLSLYGEGPYGLLGKGLDQKLGNDFSKLTEEHIDTSIPRLATQAGDLIVFKSRRQSNKKLGVRDFNDSFIHRSGDGVRMSIGIEMLQLRDVDVLPPEV